LADSQANYIGRLPLSLESNNGIAGALLNIERYNLGLDYYQRYEGIVRSVTRADVLETARKYIDPDRLVYPQRDRNLMKLSLALASLISRASVMR
jgi:zinc protease